MARLVLADRAQLAASARQSDRSSTVVELQRLEEHSARRHSGRPRSVPPAAGPNKGRARAQRFAPAQISTGTSRDRTARRAGPLAVCGMCALLSSARRIGAPGVPAKPAAS